jgi:UDP-N-acetylglucosamine 2-epimerase (hydrolysing)
VGGLRNIKVAHIEGGEESGTIDGLIRHSVSKLSTTHFVANELAAQYLVNLKESRERIFVIGSPDVDIMMSSDLPTFEQVQSRYEIPWEEYGILLFHPVTFEVDDMERQMREILAAVESSTLPIVAILPNNDYGSLTILDSISNLSANKRVRIIPSLRFEYFLTLLRNAKFILGNSSAGVREAPYYGVPTINIGSRQRRRSQSSSILNISCTRQEITSAIEKALNLDRSEVQIFGTGVAAKNAELERILDHTN